MDTVAAAGRERLSHARSENCYAQCNSGDRLSMRASTSFSPLEIFVALRQFS